MMEKQKNNEKSYDKKHDVVMNIHGGEKEKRDLHL